MKPSP